jgi:phospholipid-binding lipoprotein MlaA
MLPVLGQSAPRDLSRQAVDVGLDPMTWLRFKQHIWWQAGREYFTILDLRAQIGHFYAAARSLYRQHRENEIRNGNVPKENLPDL